MTRLMSVSYTEQAVRDRRKTVTRRLGWKFLKPGDRLTLCRKVMGLKPGEKIERICDVQVVSVNREPIRAINDADVVREGFPHLNTEGFVRWFCREFRLTPDTEVTRIQWRYL